MLWVDVLNRALEWPTGAVHPQGGSRLEAVAGERLSRDAQVLRSVCAARLLASELAPDEAKPVSQWLATVTLNAENRGSELGDEPASELGMPQFVARRRSGSLVEPFESLLSTSLLQLLSIPSAWLQTAARRCHGVRPGPAATEAWPGAWEARFAAHAGIERMLATADLHQCPRVVWSERGGRFCSKACSNAAFAADKARRDPRYFAEKQERYRARRRRVDRAPPPKNRGAFVYID
ncbi:MAG TPA: hypothetical protein VFD07_01780 [Candidatus Krumholzibacteria bacterium]|nr:hypothetical protein [Candidatus Krumholzibacteria bacterium]